MADFPEHGKKFANLGVRLVALSVDSETNARKAMARHGLTFPVPCKLDAQETPKRIGCYLNPDPVCIQPTGVILLPDCTVALVVYSSGPVGRLVAKDTAGLIEYRRKGG